MEYIDAKCLRKEIKRLEKAAHKFALGCSDSELRKFFEGKDFAYQHVGFLITSLQQEQPDTEEQSSHLEHWLAFFGCPEENIEKCATQIAQGYGAIRFLEGIQLGAEAVNELAQQEQTDNEDIDKVAQELYEHLYELKRRNNVPTNLYDKQEIIDLWKAGIVYGRSHPKQEQPDVDLEAEIEMEWDSFNKHLAEYGEESEDVVWLNWHSFNDVARHFYRLRLSARKEK